MTKGTPSFGKRGKSKSHIICRRCGRHSFSLTHRRCSACGYGNTRRIRGYSWQTKKLTRVRIV